MWRARQRWRSNATAEARHRLCGVVHCACRNGPAAQRNLCKWPVHLRGRRRSLGVSPRSRRASREHRSGGRRLSGVRASRPDYRATHGRSRSAGTPRGGFFVRLLFRARNSVSGHVLFHLRNRRAAQPGADGRRALRWRSDTRKSLAAAGGASLPRWRRRALTGESGVA
ncbi:MAG: hypothetical protein [Microviridae sp.]|nr:MAG: hypothetical protein [Microviridae sp.]